MPVLSIKCEKKLYLGTYIVFVPMWNPELCDENIPTYKKVAFASKSCAAQIPNSPLFLPEVLLLYLLVPTNPRGTCPARLPRHLIIRQK